MELKKRMLEETEEKKKLVEKLESLSKVSSSTSSLTNQGTPGDNEEDKHKELEAELVELKARNQDLIDQFNNKEDEYNQAADECMYCFLNNRSEPSI